MSKLKSIQNRSKTRNGLLVWAVILAGVTYINASLAIDTGSYWFYFLTFTTLFIGLHFVAKYFKTYASK